MKIEDKKVMKADTEIDRDSVIFIQNYIFLR